MHLILVTTSFPLLNDGSEAAGTFVVDIANALSEEINVTVVAPGRSTAIEKAGDRLTIQRFYAPKQPLSLLKPGNPFHWPIILKTLHSGMSALNHIVQNEQTDHILALWALPSGYWAEKTGIPYSIWALGSDIWGLRRIPLVRSILKRTLKKATHCFADGYQLATDVTAISGRECHFLPSSRHLPVSDKKRLSTGPPYKLAFLGRWHHNKGVDLLIDALNLLDNSDWQKISEVRICGGGPLEDEVNKGVSLLQINNRPVTLKGYLNRQEAADLLFWADYLLLPSRIESIPIIFSDALQANCPLISTPVGDLPRLMAENGPGLLAEKVTAVDFSRAICLGLAENPAHFENNLVNLRRYFGIEQAVARFTEMIHLFE